jgi:hypothetical protein
MARQPLAPCAICHVFSSGSSSGGFDHGRRRDATSPYDVRAVQYLLRDTQGNTVTTTLR